jgi:hypothetical protein
VETAALALKQRYRRAEAKTEAEWHTMTDHPTTAHPPDISLILRAHAEQLWLLSEVVPIVRQLEQAGVIPEDQIGAALAYLEVLWLDASGRAAETDAARAALDRASAQLDRVLYEKARRYHAAVRRLRTAVGRRVAALTGLTGPSGQAPTRSPTCDRYASS